MPRGPSIFSFFDLTGNETAEQLLSGRMLVGKRHSIVSVHRCFLNDVAEPGHDTHPRLALCFALCIRASYTANRTQELHRHPAY